MKKDLRAANIRFSFNLLTLIFIGCIIFVGE